MSFIYTNIGHIHIICPISYDIRMYPASVQHQWLVNAVCVEAGLIQIMLGPTTKKIRRSDGKWLVIEITIANIVRRARFDKFDLARTAIARTRNPARLGSVRYGTARLAT